MLSSAQTLPTKEPLAVLFAAIDDRRTALGLSWREATEAINALFARSFARPLSQSTITGLRSAALAEVDGVLQMLRWLDLAPEALTGNVALARNLPSLGAEYVLRIDAARLYSALNYQRLARGLTWSKLAVEVGGAGASALTRLARGGRVAFPFVLRLTTWLERPLSDFVTAASG